MNDLLITLDIHELARILHYTPAAVKFKLYTNPATLPPRIKNLKKPLWSKKIVAEWIENNSIQPAKRGRPKKRISQREDIKDERSNAE